MAYRHGCLTGEPLYYAAFRGLMPRRLIQRNEMLCEAIIAVI